MRDNLFRAENCTDSQTRMRQYAMAAGYQTNQLYSASEHQGGMEIRTLIGRLHQLRAARLRRTIVCRFACAAAAALLCAPAGILLSAQSGQPASSQTPKTSEPAAQILSSYEGQNVTAVEIAGRPEANTAQYTSSFAQQAGQPFSNDQVDRTATALKQAAKCDGVRVQVEPEANGVRVLFVLEPAVYFGIFEFPGAKRFNYSRLVQVANYPTQTAFNAGDVEQDRQALVTFFRQQGFFQSDVKAEVKVDSRPWGGQYCLSHNAGQTGEVRRYRHFGRHA